MNPEGLQLDALLAQLDLPEKVALLTGRDFWSTMPIEHIGLRSIVFSDGPSGVRGSVWDERSPSLSLPSATALSASWDLQLANEYGRVAASEARRKGVDVVLGPTVNLHRSPLGGRHFEAFSEDPILTAELAASYVAGVQQHGVAATPKHYVANDFETERYSASVSVDERTLRELYLLAFEKAVAEAHAWVVMSAYNGINGVTASENDLLETPLNSEWGFDGVVVSDWTGVRSIAAARASQDLAMPGPVSAWGDALLAAVQNGEVTEEAIDRKVRRILLLAARVGALEGFEKPAMPSVDGIAFARRAAAAGTVMVRNDGILPLPAAPGRIAVIGHNARAARTQGGGSATVIPEGVVTPLDGITAAFPDARIDYAPGAVVQEGLSELPLGQLRNPATGGRGVRVRFLDDAERELFAEDRLATSFLWFGGDAPVARAAIIEATTVWTPSRTETVRFGFAAVGRGQVSIDGEILVEDDALPEGADLGAAILSPPTLTAVTDVVAGRDYEVTVRLSSPPADGGLAGIKALTFGIQPDDSDPEGLLVEAERAAAGADVVVLVVGTSSRVESEGFDRTELALPGRQDELARRVLEANPHTIVVVNSGAPVALPWAGKSAAVLLSWFGGQEYGHAIADVLTGAVEPGGRLPTTWGRSLDDVPVSDVTPRDGVLEYREGINIGYRAWLEQDREPLFWFGAGSGYTTFSVGLPTVTEAADHGVEATVTVKNTGARPGKHVVQLYASRPASAVVRPPRWLVGFGVVELDSGSSAEVRLRVPPRRFAHWDDGWRYEAGVFHLAVCKDAGDAGMGVDLDLGFTGLQ
jgi:beta-glucosidase